MSVTRYIKKNTPVQVNSHLIGVEVYPDDVFTGITVKGHWTSCRCANVPANTAFWTSVNEVVYTKTPLSVEIETVTYYMWYRSPFWTADSGYPQDLWITAQNIDSSNIGDTLYTIDQTDPENPVVAQYDENLGNIVPAYTGGNKYFIQLTDVVAGECIIGLYGDVENSLYRLNMNSSSVYTIDGDYFSIVNRVPSNVTNQNIVCDSYNQDGYWIDSDSTTYNGPLYGSATPAVGDTLNFYESKSEYNQQTVDSLNYVPGTANCVVEYSVTGDEWTQVGSNLTDVNNVIANIPKYVYLRFSQDVEITEE